MGHSKRWLSIFTIVLLSSCSAYAAKKNVLLIIADDLGFQLGCYGDEQAKTPHLDALAKTSTLYTHAFASVASCSSSRATILTGMPTHMCGQYGLAHATHNSHSFHNVKGLPALLKPAGYKSGCVAKLHVQPAEVYPFDSILPDGGRNPVSASQKARKFIENTGDTPFFLLVGFTDPHRAAKGFANQTKYPASVPAISFEGDKLKLPSFLHDAPEVRQEWAEYYQSVSRLDHGVGLLMQVLRETNTLDDTLVIFLSDNGPPFPGAKTTLYDPGIHLPLMIKVPGQSTGTHSTTLASFTDIAPTILEWTGVAKPKNLVGRSLLGAKNSQESASPTEVFASHQFHEVTMYYPMRMIRTRTHKLILNLASALEFPHASDLWNSPTWQGVLKRKAQLIGQRQVSAFLNRPQFELYDLTKDPGELHNIAEKEPELRQELLVKLKDWQEATNDPWLVKYVHE